MTNQGTLIHIDSRRPFGSSADTSTRWSGCGAPSAIPRRWRRGSRRTSRASEPSAPTSRSSTRRSAPPPAKRASRRATTARCSTAGSSPTTRRRCSRSRGAASSSASNCFPTGDDTCSCSRRSSAISRSRRGTAAAGTCASAISTRCSTWRAPERDGWNDVYQDYLERMGPELGTPAGDGAVRGSGPPTSSRPRPRRHHGPDRDRSMGRRRSRRRAGAVGGRAGRGPHRLPAHPSRASATTRELAATWHALLIQLDMYLAAGQLIPVDPKPLGRRLRRAAAVTPEGGGQRAGTGRAPRAGACPR